MPRSDLRIVSLIASATEIVAALRCGDRLVGRSHECDWPPDVARLPMCSAPRIDVHGSSREIDERVKDALRDAMSVYRVDAGLLEELQPTHIITQTQCEVCAVSLKDVEQAVCDLVSSKPQIVSLAPMCLADVWEDIQRVADALGDSDAGRRLVASSQDRLESVAQRAKRQPVRPTMACIEWIEPLMCAGNWVPELVELAGGRDVLGRAGVHSPYMTIDALAAADPDVIAVMPCGFDIARTREEMKAMSSSRQWRDLRAVHVGRVFLTDGNQYFNRPGPRLVESAEILAELLHPDVFPPLHRASGWEPWSPGHKQSDESGTTIPT